MGFFSGIGDFFEDVFETVVDIITAPLDWVMDAFIPDMPVMPTVAASSPTYSDPNKIGNTISEGIFVARCYGECKIGGNKLRFNAATDSDLRIIVGHCQGPVYDLLHYTVNDIEWAYLPAGCTKSEYTGTRSQTPDARFSDKESAYRGMAYTAFTFPKNDKQIGYDPTITLFVRGLLCAPLAGGANVWTRNPAVILYDWYLNVEGYSAGDLDLNAFKSLEALCDESITEGGITLPRYYFDFNFDTNMTINDAKKVIWASFNGQSIMSQGKIKPIWDSAQIEDGSGGLTAKTVSHAFTVDNIVKDSLEWSVPEKPNIVRIHFKDRVKGHTASSVEIKDELDIAKNGEILFEENAWFITYAAMAQRRARFKFNKKRYPDYTAKFTALSGASDLEVLDLVTITHLLPGWTTKQFLITSRSEDELGRMKFTVEAYFPGVYDDSQVGTQVGFESILPNVYQIPAASTSITAAMTAVGSAYDFDAVRVSFAPPTGDPFYSYSEVYASKDDSTYYYIGNSDGTGSYTFNALGVVYEPGDNCYIKLRSVSENGIFEDLPAAYDALVSVTATMKLAGFYAGTNDLWGGNADIAHADTLIVLGNLDGTPKISLGVSADALTISNMTTHPGFYADGDGNVRGGNAGGGFVATAGTFTISGDLIAGTIHVPDKDTTANSFHVDADGNMWLGCTEANFNTDNDNATSYILKTGVAKFQSITITNGIIAGLNSDPTDGLYSGDGGDRVQMKPGVGIWCGANAIADGPFNVTNAGVLTAKSGTIGGFTLAETTLTATNLLLDAGNQKIKLGSSNDIITMDAADATYRLAIGHATYASAPFRVTKSGALTATNATISGTITATTGAIGGWSINATSIYTGTEDHSGYTANSGDLTLYSNGADASIHAYNFYINSSGEIVAKAGSISGWILSATTLANGTNIILDASNKKISINDAIYGNDGIQIDYNSGNPRAYIGDGSNQYFQFDGTDTFWKGNNAELTKAGELTVSNISATGGTIGGWILAENTLSSANITLDKANDKITVNTITIDGANNRIRSSNYVSGIFGAGFTLEPDLLEVGNIRARGMIRTAVFQKDVVSAVGGNLAVLPADVLAVDMTAADGTTHTRITEAGDTRITEAGDTRITEAGIYDIQIDGEETFAVGDILRIKDGLDDEWMEVLLATDAPIYRVLRDKSGNYAANTNPTWKKGAAVVNFKQSGDGAVYMTSSESNAPYLSVFTHAGSPWSSITTRLRLGNLNGFLGYTSDLYGIAIGETDKYLKYDPTNGLRIKGDITVTNGSGILSFTDAGGLAVLDEVTAGEINVTTLSAITADIGTVTAGTIQSTNWDASNGMQIDLDNATFTVREASGLVVDSTGGISVAAGGDITLTGDDVTPGSIIFDGTYDTELSSYGSGRDIYFKGTTDEMYISYESTYNGTMFGIGHVYYFRNDSDSREAFCTINVTDIDRSAGAVKGQYSISVPNAGDVQAVFLNEYGFTMTNSAVITATDEHAVLYVRTKNNTGVYDPQIHFQTNVSYTTKAVMGVDDGDDTLRIGTGTTLAAATAMKVDSSNNVIFSGDLRLSNGNYIGISGNERLEFYTAGYAAFMGCNVGIGTTSPDFSLHLTKDATDCAIALENTGNDGRYYIITSTGDGNSEGNGKLLFLDNSAGVRAVIDSTGKFGVDNTSPTGLLQLGPGSYSATNGSYDELHAGAFTVTFKDGYDCYLMGNANYASAGFYNKYDSHAATYMGMAGGFTFAIGTGTTAGAASNFVNKLFINSSGVLPGTSNALTLGNASYYWTDVSYKTLTDRGCLGWFDEGVEMQDGTIVSDLEALKAIKKHPTKKTVYGVPMLDYKSMPKAIYKPADDKGKLLPRDKDDNPYNFDEQGKKIPAQDGAETTALLSVMLGAIKELEKEIKKWKSDT